MAAHDTSALATREALESAYNVGDFGKLRRDARRVLDQRGEPSDAATLEAARVLYARTTVDRWTLAVLGFAALSLCVIVLRYVF